MTLEQILLPGVAKPPKRGKRFVHVSQGSACYAQVSPIADHRHETSSGAAL